MHRRLFLMLTSAMAVSTACLPVAAQDGPQAVVEAYVAAWNAHDSAKAAEFFAENVVYYDASLGSPMNGKADAKGIIDGFLTAVPDVVWKMKGAPIVQDGRVSFEWEFSGTNTGDWPDGAKATGKKFSIPGTSVFGVNAGKIETQSDYYDALGFYKQLGLM